MADQENYSERTDQAHRLRQLVLQRDSDELHASGSTHVIAVTSGKGGVGKTFLAVNLSIALAARNHRVILFDMDMGLANADIVLGVQPNFTWNDVLKGRRSLDDIMVQGPGQIAFVPASSGIAHMADLSEFERYQLRLAMHQIECRYDVVILDCGAGISQNVVGFASSADTVLVTATPEPTAITDAYAMIKTFAVDPAGNIYNCSGSSSIGVLVNQAESRREGCETYERLAQVAARFLHLPVSDFGYILRDDHVSAAVRQRCPVILRYPRCSASTCLMAVAGKLAHELGQPESSKSLFYRVMNMFL
ncbi:MAG: AAA family ATPase [Planctomycetota bacterium]|nr:MAG: AAA family ATPase [Planctomycetota bacterium]